MLSLPDFNEKQILFIQAERGSENKIKFWNDNFRFTKDGKTVNQISCHKLFAVFVIGDISITSVLMQKSQKYGISQYFLDNRLNQYASINSQTEGHYLLRQKQYSFQDDLLFSKHLVQNKIANQHVLLKEIGKPGVMNLEILSTSINNCADSTVLLGIEGNASKIFFEHYFTAVGWTRRMPRAKRDLPNAVLDIGYYYLFNFVDTLLRLYGFDTYKGIYHKLFFQRRSLSCDIMEPFRCLIDRQVRKSYNLKQFKESDFYIKDNQYLLKYDKSSQYGQIFVDTLLDHRENIYKYIRSFYRCLLDETVDYPQFVTLKEE